MNKKKIVVLIVVIAVILLTFGAFWIVNNIKKTQEELGNVNSHETFKKIYDTEDNVMYYSNDQEKIYKFSGYNNLDEYFYNNVTCGYDSSYKSFLIDINEKYIVEPGIFDSITRASEKYYYIVKDSKRGVIDYEGNIIIPAEYSSVRYNKDDDITYFTAEKSSEKEYYLFNEEGKIIIKTDKQINSIDVDCYKGINSKSPNNIRYDGVLYNIENGKVLLKDLDEGVYTGNFFCKDSKLTIYDESFKVKKEINDFNWNADLDNDENGRKILTIGEKEYYLNDDIELVEINKEQEEKDFIKKEGFTEIEDAEYHVLSNGDKYITKVEESSNSIIICDKSGKEIKSVSVGNANQVKKIYSIGNYLVVVYGSYNRGNLLDISTGEFIVKSTSNINYYDENKIIMAYIGSGANTEYTLINENFKLEFNKNYNFEMCKDSFWALDEKNKKAYLYDLNGNVIKEIAGVESEYQLADGYFMYVIDEGKSKIIKNETGNITFEFELTSNDFYKGYYFPYKYYKDDIGIIELADGLYNLNGKKLIEKD